MSIGVPDLRLSCQAFSSSTASWYPSYKDKIKVLVRLSLYKKHIHHYDRLIVFPYP